MSALAQARQQTAKETTERDWRNFILAGIAAHPESARSWLKLLRQDGDSEPLDEDRPEDYVPVQERSDLEEKIRQLQTLGFSYSDD